MDGEENLMHESAGVEGSSGGRDVDFDGDLGGKRLPWSQCQTHHLDLTFVMQQQRMAWLIIVPTKEANAE